jgi:hypothetical protein
MPRGAMKWAATLGTVVRPECIEDAMESEIG